MRQHLKECSRHLRHSGLSVVAVEELAHFPFVLSEVFAQIEQEEACEVAADVACDSCIGLTVVEIGGADGERTNQFVGT